METSKVNWLGNKNYNMNCKIEDLEKLGFWNSSYHHDLAPSYISKCGRYQIYFLDPNDEGIENEKIEYKFSLLKLDENTEYDYSIGQYQTFDEVLNQIEKDKNEY